MRPDKIFALDSYHTVARGPRRYTDLQIQRADFKALVVAVVVAATALQLTGASSALLPPERNWEV
jgi:hypothetical protein